MAQSAVTTPNNAKPSKRHRLNNSVPAVTRALWAVSFLGVKARQASLKATPTLLRPAGVSAGMARDWWEMPLTSPEMSLVLPEGASSSPEMLTASQSRWTGL